MRKLLITGIVALAACSGNPDPDDVGDPDTGATDWSVQLESRAGTDVRGSATVQSVVLEDVAATTVATVRITGSTVGSRHPWHVHSGTCATGGPIMGDASEYPVLDVGADGEASEDADLGIGLDEDANYHVNIHRSPSDLGTIIACGNLVD